jgi:hypothetical protein
MGTLSSSNSTKHHGTHFSNHTLMLIYQESKINKQVNKDKHHTKHKIYEDSFYLIFFDSTLIEDSSNLQKFKNTLEN